MNKFSHQLRTLLDDAAVSKEQKIRSLEDVRLDLLEQLRATEENMEEKAAIDAGEIGDQLQEVTKALARLRGDESSSQ